MYLDKRQHGVPQADSDELEGFLSAVVRWFDLAWLRRDDGNPVQILWNRKDALATHELFILGDAIIGSEVGNREWLRRRIRVIKNGDAGNRAGAAFELLALNLFRSPKTRVLPADENNPGFDAKLSDYDGNSNVLLSIKNHGASAPERDFVARSKTLDRKLQTWLRARSLNALDVRIELSDHPTSADWTDLEADLRNILWNIREKRKDEITTSGRWTISIDHIDREYWPLSEREFSSSFVISSGAHKNEQANFQDNIRKACANLARHLPAVSDSCCPALLIRLPPSASINGAIEWGINYFLQYPNEPIGIILLYQAAVITGPQASTIGHYIGHVMGPRFDVWRRVGEEGMRQFPPMTATIGEILDSPPAGVMRHRGTDVAIKDRYVYQRAEIYRRYRIEDSPQMMLSSPAPGVIIHAVLEGSDGSNTWRMLTSADGKLQLLA